MVRVEIGYALLALLVVSVGWIVWRVVRHYRREHARVWGRRRRR